MHNISTSSLKGAENTMNMQEISTYYSNLPEKNSSSPSSRISVLKFYTQNERKILKALLLSCLHRLFCEIFHNKIQPGKTNSSMECYTMDGKIIQFLIDGIVETKEYTLEGIAYYTRIPFDVIFDAACGNNNQLSITPWARVADLYLQVKPDVVQLLFNKLIEIKDKNHFALSLLLNEQ